MSKGKIITIIVIVALILGAGITLYFLRGKNKDPQITYEYAEVTRGNIYTAVTATGTVEPVTQVEVGTQVSGIVDKIYVDYNSTVKKGQVIAVLDKSNLESELASSRASVNNCKVELDYQKKEYERTKALYDRQMVSTSDYDLALYSYQRAQNSYEMARQNLTKAQTNLSYATIYSPIDGVVLSKSVEEGQTVASSFSTPTLFLIAEDLTQMRVIANVDEADIGDVYEGLHVTFSVDAFPGLTFDGQVQQVRQEATTTSNVVTYEVVISAPNPELKLKPGMTANVSIYTMERNDVLLIPSKALKYTPEVTGIDSLIDCEGRNKVWTREGHCFIAYGVKLGASTGTQTEVLNGLDEGQRVVVGEIAGYGVAADEEVGAKQQTERSPFMPNRRGNKSKK